MSEVDAWAALAALLLAIRRPRSAKGIAAYNAAVEALRAREARDGIRGDLPMMGVERLP